MTNSRRPKNRLAILLIPLAAASCAGDQQGGGRRPATPSTTAPRAAPAGGLIGGHDNRTRSITGAGVVPLPAAEAGGYLDRFERDLRMKTAGTGIDLARRDASLLLTIPARIAFDGNSATIAPTIRTTLDAIARVLAQYHQSYVDVAGFTGQVADEGAATAISQGQAQSVASYLQLRGVLAARIGTQGYGAAGANGRVEIKLVPLTEADLPPAAG
jgi:outer membrane protein OmpA-like peptidoglycan-associated protein